MSIALSRIPSYSHFHWKKLRKKLKMLSMPQSPNQLANLRPFGPDNPPPKSTGRPRKRPVTEEYDDLLRELLPEKERRALGLPAGTTWARALALARAREGLTRGGTAAHKEIADRVEGKATQRIEANITGDVRTEFVVTYANPLAGKRPDAINVDAKVVNDAPADSGSLPQDPENKHSADVDVTGSVTVEPGEKK